MTTKHTRGPWSVRDDERDWAIIGPEPSWVCAIDKRNHNAKANATLTAAAPDLLAALERCVFLLDVASKEIAAKDDSEFEYDGSTCDATGHRTDCENAIDRAQRAIAKARGQS
jgi:hypothetical protein